MTRDKQVALAEAQRLTDETGREFIVREDYGVYLVGPRYLLGCEGYRHDPGFAALGLWVTE